MKVAETGRAGVYVLSAVFKSHDSDINLDTISKCYLSKQIENQKTQCQARILNDLHESAQSIPHLAPSSDPDSVLLYGWEIFRRSCRTF